MQVWSGLVYGVRDGMVRAGLVMALPWAVAITACVYGGCLLLGVATAGRGAPWAMVAAMLVWPALGIGLFLCGVLAISGTVTRPLGRAFGGVGVGLLAAMGLTVASCAGLGGAATADAGWMVGVAAIGALVAVPSAGGWAWLRYDAGAAGITAAAAWAAIVAAAPLFTYGVIRWLS